MDEASNESKHESKIPNLPRDFSGEERRVKSEKYKKKKPLSRLFFLEEGYKKDIFERVLTGFELSDFMPTLIVQ